MDREITRMEVKMVTLETDRMDRAAPGRMAMEAVPVTAAAEMVPAAVGITAAKKDRRAPERPMKALLFPTEKQEMTKI